jgi:branched-chain amino acid transport system ATP-binding protein
MLKLNNVNTAYGPVHVLKDVSFEVKQGEIVTLIGANGAGKSTLLRTISGLLKPLPGSEIILNGKDISILPPNRIVRMGISQVPEGRRVFPGLTVRENLEVGATIRLKGFMHNSDIEKDIEEIFSRFPRLKERSSQLAWSLSGGEQQMLAIGRALISRPKLLLLDEPSLGLAPNLVLEVFKIIRSINAEGTTVLLVEQNAAMALKTAHRGYVIEIGRIVKSGTGPELLGDPAVKAAYLGIAHK